MTWRDCARLAAAGILRRRGRSALTALGVALGAALLVCLGSVSSVAESRAVEQFGQGLPVGAIKVAPARPLPYQLQSDEFEKAGPHRLGDPAIADFRQIPGVKDVLPIEALFVLAVPANGESFNATMVGTNLSVDPASMPFSLVSGRLPNPHSLTEVAVTQQYASSAPIGSELQLVEPRGSPSASTPPPTRWVRATVVGILSSGYAGADLVVPLGQTSLARQWESPPANASPYLQAIVVAASTDNVHSIREEIADLGYSSSAPEHVLGAVLRYLHVVDIVLTGIGAVAVVIAGLNIANAMLAAVRERRREIGTLKAIGARDVDVLRWFLVEASLLGLLGGIVGTATGGLMALAIGGQVSAYLEQQGIVLDPPTLSDIPFTILAAGIAGSTLLAAIAALIPALRGARLPAKEAMATA